MDFVQERPAPRLLPEGWVSVESVGERRWPVTGSGLLARPPGRGEIGADVRNYRGNLASHGDRALTRSALRLRRALAPRQVVGGVQGIELVCAVVPRALRGRCQDDSLLMSLAISDRHPLRGSRRSHGACVRASADGVLDGGWVGALSGYFRAVGVRQRLSGPESESEGGNRTATGYQGPADASTAPRMHTCSASLATPEESLKNALSWHAPPTPVSSPRAWKPSRTPR